ncbi:MAG: hypothetical protein M0R17_03015 [Candidatus Omnitrophica bacterium]|jgi:hypothetical protein|nr:hypothetical protein [Candidatus Omnitrophota bacterium]
MKTAPEISTEYGLSNVLNNLLNFELNSKEFLANETVVTKIGTLLDEFKKVEHSNILFSIIRNKQRQLIFILKENQTYIIAKWNLIEEIEKSIDVIIHENNNNDKLSNLIQQHRCNNFNISEIISAIVVPTLTGYSINKSQLNSLLDYKKEDESRNNNTYNDLIKYNENFKELVSIKNRLSDLTNIQNEIINKLKNNINDKNIVLNTKFNINSNLSIFFGEITSVKEVGDRRYYILKWFQDSNCGTCHNSKSSGTSEQCRPYKNIFSLGSKNVYREYNIIDYIKIPYNLIDKGRLFIGLATQSHSWDIFASQDPKVNENYKLILEQDILSFLKEECEDNFNIDGTYIEDKNLKAKATYDQYEYTDHTKDLTGIRKKLKALSIMSDEFNYVVKKNSALGEDVTITENIKYNHTEGKIKYNDFSISINDEYIKSKLYTLFNNYLISYYRNEITEQDILDKLIEKIFNELDSRLTLTKKEDLNIPININEKININITGKISKRCAKTETGEKDESQVISSSQLYYINDRRFNKNEIIMVLKEITCYQNQQEADNFIENIGRLGLSVYIGISTGYEVDLSKKSNEENNKLFRFKKLKGRSNYELLLDDTSIKITGKKIISLLYSNFIEDRIPDLNDKIQKCIIDGSESCIDYIKYKTLIDSTYKAFKDKSKEYLDKKVSELNAQYVKYHNKKTHKLMDGIKLTGLSGKEYIISYNNKDSYVFMNPIKTDTDYYSEGKYICMIDQSNIKSNISYDTVIAKMLALKNDSSIAHTIYNLQEEL